MLSCSGTMLVLTLFSLFALSSVTSANNVNPGTESCSRRCKSTCAVPNPPNCISNKNCTCKEGYIYPNKRNNTCIPIYQCPQDAGCNGDDNAIIQQRVLLDPSTCKNPDQSYRTKGPTIGCVCKYGFILSEKGGTCIPLEDCPGGNPCGQNRTFTSCTSCKYNPCPTSEFQVRYGCDPIWPCPSGCICDNEYKSLGGLCVLPEDCPPVKCRRPNEEWDRCPSPCVSDRCTDIPKWSEPCESLGSCFPRCRCKEDYARSNNGTCIPIEQCPLQCTEANEEVNTCPSPCYTDSCSDVPYRTAPCNTLLPVECVPQCQCKSNYARGDDGTCIPLDQCPP